MRNRNKKRPLLKKIAVVGEGETEWFYFNDLKDSESLKFELKPQLPQHTSYKSIFKKSEQLLKEGFDKVYCVLDLDTVLKDSVQTNRYFSEKQKIVKKYREKLLILESNPCIEYWFLLHYIYTSCSHHSCENILTDLRKYLCNYEKKQKYLSDIYSKLKDKLETAKIYGEKSIKERERKGDLHCSFTEIQKFFNF
jgi:hypothetical protein